MSYSDGYFLSTQADFLGRVEIALLSACKDVIAEDPTTTFHTQRVAYAIRAIADPDTYARNAAKMVMTNPAIVPSFDKNNTRYTTTATDDDLQFTVNSLFNALAGAAK